MEKGNFTGTVLQSWLQRASWTQVKTDEPETEKEPEDSHRLPDLA